MKIAIFHVCGDKMKATQQDNGEIWISIQGYVFQIDVMKESVQIAARKALAKVEEV